MGPAPIEGSAQVLIEFRASVDRAQVLTSVDIDNV